MELGLDLLLQKMVELGASDLHISSGNHPIVRISGRLSTLSEYPVLTVEKSEELLLGILTEDQRHRLVADKEIDFSRDLANARFRGNIFMERLSLAGAFRMIPPTPKTLDELGVPQLMKELALRKQGLVLVTGPSGSGKSTTLASTLEYLNDHRSAHVVTIEDPIEYSFQNRMCLIHQREVGPHTHSFHQALRSVLRQDPDIIMVGEMRDRETVETALLAAETGHLVFSTLHTNNAVDSVHRIMDFFQEEQQSHFQLAATLLAVFSQQLVPSTESSRNLVMACEVMLVTPAVQNMIREGKIHQIRNMLTTGSADGMKTMELALKELYDQEKITFESGLAHSFDPSTFRRMCGQDLARNIVVRDTGKSVSDLAPRGSHPSALTGATAGKWV